MWQVLCLDYCWHSLKDRYSCPVFLVSQLSLCVSITNIAVERVATIIKRKFNELSGTFSRLIPAMFYHIHKA